MKCRNVCSMFFLVIVSGLMMLSCGSKKVAQSGNVDLSGSSDASYIKGVIDRAARFNEFSAKMRFLASYGGEKLEVGGSIKMKKDEFIQLSLVAVGIVEAARIEMTPKKMLVVDRIGRRYVDIPYDELGFFKDCQIDFYTLQALFWNEIFLLGTKHVADGDVSEFKLSRGDNQVMLTAGENKRLNLSFITALVSGALEKSCIHAVSKKKKSYELDWSYSDFMPLGSHSFPSEMSVSLKGAEKPAAASLRLFRWEPEVTYKPVTVSDRYKRLEASDLLKILLTL